MTGFKHKCGVCLQPKEALTDLSEVDTSNESWTCKLQFIVPEVEWLNILKICIDCTQETDHIYRFRRTCIKFDEERQQLALEYQYSKEVVNNYQSEDQTDLSLKCEQSLDNKQCLDDQTSVHTLDCSNSENIGNISQSEGEFSENQQHSDDRTLVCSVKLEEPQEISSDCLDSDNNDNNCQLEEEGLFENQQHLKDHTYFSRKRILTKHMQDKNKQASDRSAEHKDSTKYTCDNCHKEYNGQKLFVNHLNKCEGLKVLLLDTQKVSFKCSSCCEVFNTCHALKTHRKHCLAKLNGNAARVRGGRDPRFQRSCEICNRKFDYIKPLIDHCVKDHSMDPKSVKPFCCPHCPKRFSFSGSLVGHKRSHGGIRKHTCTFCDKSFFKAESLRLHESYRHLNKRDYICDTCGKAYKTKPNLYSHIWVVHTDKSQWKYSCDLCGRRSPYRTSHELHMSRHTGDRRFPCNICGKSFVSQTECSKHKRKNHTSTPDRLFQCEHCSTCFESKKVLRRHLFKAHTIGDAPISKRIICPVCSKSITKQNIKPHMRTHMGTKSVLCHLCGKKFTRRHNMDLHLKVAHNVQPDEKPVDKS